MTTRGYKSASVPMDELPDWESALLDSGFHSSAEPNPLYTTTIIEDVWDADRYTSIQTYLENQLHLGLSLKCKLYEDMGKKSKKFKNLVGLMCVAGPKRVIAFRCHKDTR